MIDDSRVAHEHRGLRLEVRGALLPLDRGHEPADESADADSAVGPRGRRLVPHGLHARRPQGARERDHDGRQRPGLPDHAGRAGRTQQGRDQLHPVLPGPGHPDLGRRTLSSDPEWRYINVRRLFNYVAESIMEGTQWSVFEPNDQRLWMQLRIA